MQGVGPAIPPGRQLVNHPRNDVGGTLGGGERVQRPGVVARLSLVFREHVAIRCLPLAGRHAPRVGRQRVVYRAHHVGDPQQGAGLLPHEPIPEDPLPALQRLACVNVCQRGEQRGERQGLGVAESVENVLDGHARGDEPTGLAQHHAGPTREDIQQAGVVTGLARLP